jgi:hypothetical protein
MENTGETKENLENLTPPERVEIVREEDHKKEEQARTTWAKQKFLEYMEKTMGMIKIAADQAEVSRQTYYNWYKDDPDFRAEVDRIKKQQIGEVEDRLVKAIMNDNVTAIMFYLRAKHPDYYPKDKFIIPMAGGAQSLEDLLDNYKNDEHELAGQQGVDRTALENPQQAGVASPLSVQRSAELLLGETDTKKPDIESETKGNK